MAVGRRPRVVVSRTRSEEGMDGTKKEESTTNEGHRHISGNGLNSQTRAGVVVGSVTLERVNGYPCGVGREWGCLFANILSALSSSAGLASLGPPLLYHR